MGKIVFNAVGFALAVFVVASTVVGVVKMILPDKK